MGVSNHLTVSLALNAVGLFPGQKAGIISTNKQDLAVAAGCHGADRWD